MARKNFKMNNLKVFTIKNDFIEVEVLNLGASLISFKHMCDDVNIVLRYEDLESYRENGGPYLGATIGPTSGRIAYGKYDDLVLTLNNDVNHLHGGHNGLHQVFFKIANKSDSSLVLKASVDHQTDGYPGTIDYTITYRLENESLIVEYTAIPSEDQYINMTNHAYFNLKGEGSVSDHELRIEATHRTEISKDLNNSGLREIKSGDFFDFNQSKLLSECFNSDEDQFKITRNLDHFYASKKLELSGDDKILTVQTDQNGFQVYGGNYFDEAFKDEHGTFVKNQSALAIEPQKEPNEINLYSNIKLSSKENPYYARNIYTLSLED